MAELTTCPICGLTYLDPLDEKAHNEVHEDYLTAVKLFGPMRLYNAREDIKSKLYPLLHSKTDPQERSEVCLSLMRIYFERSVLSFQGEDIKQHPKFETYVAMLLNQDHWKTLCGVGYDLLKSKYGTLPGIEDGHTYWLKERRI